MARELERERIRWCAQPELWLACPHSGFLSYGWVYKALKSKCFDASFAGGEGAAERIRDLEEQLRLAKSYEWRAKELSSALQNAQAIPLTNAMLCSSGFLSCICDLTDMHQQPRGARHCMAPHQMMFQLTVQSSFEIELARKKQNPISVPVSLHCPRSSPDRRRSGVPFRPL